VESSVILCKVLMSKSRRLLDATIFRMLDPRLNLQVELSTQTSVIGKELISNWSGIGVATACLGTDLSTINQWELLKVKRSYSRCHLGATFTILSHRVYWPVSRSTIRPCFPCCKSVRRTTVVTVGTRKVGKPKPFPKYPESDDE
jgi:hypothetical protein